MKKWFMTIIIILIVGILGYFTISKLADKIRMNNIKKGWHVQITNDYINIRSDHNAASAKLGEVKKDEIYKVIEIYLDNSTYFWYKIEINNKTTGWISSGKSNPFLKDINNPDDIKTPEIKIKESEYHVYSIDKINYKHLQVIDDRNDYTITHKIYHEVDSANKTDQYWIKYIVTDKSGKSSAKLQQVTFDVTPNESLVSPFSEIRK